MEHLEKPEALNRSKPQNDVKDIEDRIRHAERWMIGLTIAIAFFALCSVVVGMLQWQAMSGQLKEMKGGSADTHALAEAAKTQADASLVGVQTAQAEVKAVQAGVGATQIQARIAMEAMNASIAASRTDERAWVGVTDITIKVLKPDARFVYIGYLQNSGRTPAINVKMIFKYQTFRRTENPTFEYGNPTSPKSVFTLQPSMKISFGGFENPQDEPLSAEQIGAISAGATTMYIYGKVDYEDIFRVRHYAHVCMWVDRNLQYTHPCTDYNDTDKNSERPN